MAAPAHPRRSARRLAQLNDAELIEACIADRRDAWDELVERYGRLVYSIARRCGLDGADADEVFQNVFTIVYQKLGAVRDPERFAGWLSRTTSREAYRIGSARAAVTQEMADAACPDDELVAVWERQHVVRLALRRLGGRCEQLLRMLFLAPSNPSYQHIAEELDMKIGSIGPTRARCFGKLEEILIEMGFRGDQEP